MHAIQFCAVAKLLIHCQVYIISFQKLERLFLLLKCCFQAVVMSKSDKSLLLLWIKENLLAVCIGAEYCSLIVIGSPIRLNLISDLSIEIAIDLSLRKILPVVNHHSGSIALQASIVEKLGCVSSEAFLPLLDLFFPLFAG